MLSSIFKVKHNLGSLVFAPVYLIILIASYGCTGSLRSGKFGIVEYKYFPLQAATVEGYRANQPDADSHELFEDEHLKGLYEAAEDFLNKIGQDGWMAIKFENGYVLCYRKGHDVDGD